MKNVFYAFVVSLLISPISHAQDCNGNNVDDALDRTTTSLSFTAQSTVFPSNAIDLNGDGLLDHVATASPTSATGFFRTFQVAIQNPDGSYTSRNYGNEDAYDAIAGGLTPARANLNGYLDLVFKSFGGTYLLRNDGSGNLEPPVLIADTAFTEIEVEADDRISKSDTLLFSNDQFPDRIEAIDDTTFELFVATSSEDAASKGTYTIPNTELFGSPSGTFSADAVDFNGDGIKDLLIFFEQSASDNNSIGVTLFLFKGKENGELEQSSRILVFSDMVFVPLGSIGSVDVSYTDRNKDSYLDIFVSKSVIDRSLTSFSATVYVNDANAPFPDKNGNDILDACERAIPGDYDGDLRSDEVIVRPAGAGLDWYISQNLNNSPQAISFGLNGFDRPMPADYNGDGTFAPGVVRDIFGGLFWFYRAPNGDALMRQWGLSGDIPLTGYFDSDRSADLAVVRSSAGLLFWYITPFADGDARVEQWGLTGDTPFAADWNGDGVDELIVARQLFGGITWFIRDLDGDLVEVVQWGLSSDTLLPPADMNGDGKADLIVSRPNGILSATFIRHPAESTETKIFGLAGDRKFIGYYSGQRQGELGVFRTAPGQLNQYYVNRQPSTRLRFFGFADDVFVSPHGN